MARSTANRGDIRRINEHLSQFKTVKQHVQNHTINELQFYPAHNKRNETPEYAAVHKHMTKDLDLPCLVCGVRRSTLKNPRANRWGAKQMETHHHVIEWALANAVDVKKFNTRLRPFLAHRHPSDPVWHYEKPFDQKKIAAWVDHSEHNLWVLCDVHHRAQYLGIHEITFPIWTPMDLYLEDFEAWAATEIAKLRGKPKGAAAKVKAKRATTRRGGRKAAARPAAVLAGAKRAAGKAAARKAVTKKALGRHTVARKAGAKKTAAGKVVVVSAVKPVAARRGRPPKVVAALRGRRKSA